MRFSWPRYLKSFMHGIIYKDYRLVIPSSLPSQILQQLHEGHNGIRRTRNKAGEIYCWPGIDLDSANFVSRRVLSHNIPRNDDLQNWSDTTYPMERVHADVCHLQGKLYIIIIDSYSKFVNVIRIATGLLPNSLLLLNLHSVPWPTNCCCYRQCNRLCL